VDRKLRLLILEDIAADAELMERELRRENLAFDAQRVETKTAFVDAIRQFSPDVILSDYSLPRFNGKEALQVARELAPTVPVIIVTGSINEETAVECMRAGASDYVLKDHIGRIGTAIRLALEKQVAETRLRQSEEMFRLITNNITDLIAVLDVSGNRLYNSRSYQELFGNPEAMRGTESFREIHPDDREQIRRVFDETLQTGVGRRAEFRFMLSDGSYRYIESQGSVILDEKGKPDKVLVVSRDVTERKLAEQALRQSEERFRALIENSSDAIALLDSTGQVLYSGPSTERILGYAAAEFVGSRFFDFVHPDEVERTVRVIEQLREKPGHTAKVEFRIRHRDESWRWMEGTGKNLLNEPGVKAVVVNYRDITDRKRAETEIQKLAAFPLYNPNPILELLADGKLTYFNDAAQEMARTLGKVHPREILPPDVAAIAQSCLGAGKSRTGVEVTANGRTLSWSFFPILVGQVIHAYAEDITEKLNLENQLRQSQRMESVGQLAAGVAHDFNNILTIIQGHAELLLSDRNLSPALTEPLKHVSTAANRAANLTRQLLTFSRRQVMQPRLLDLNEVVGNVTRMLNRVLGEQIPLQCNYATNLPSILADAGLIEQLIMNLAVNARDAMPRGGQLIISTFVADIDEAYAQIHAEARPGQFVCLGVTDTGCGMDEATLRRIFEPFFTTKEVGKGTGLGLATVYGIVKLHNGWIEVESRIGMGSTFTIFVPAARSRGEPAGGPATRPVIRGGNETILVVENETALRGLMRSILQHYGYHILEASTSGEALKVWDQKKTQIDLLVTDVVLPDGLSGDELARQMRDQKAGLKVLYTSGYSLEITGQDSPLREGFNYLQKPFQPQTLAQTIRQCLDSGAA
jgi:two-component system cell cycle sensor histidine kinase/response regulator CckA